MTLNPFEIIQKPKMLMTTLDEFVIAGWIFLLFFVGFIIYCIYDEVLRRIARRKRKP